ncbi:MAG TPA: hypothetical protein VM681_04555 [Candidatus Thermoplasmatota archaeon]|nr:hypothetical protein [Candidatus Thermoplasmatota archaeon]
MADARRPEGWTDPELTTCGGCRHFEQSLTGRHACQRGLVLVDGVARTSCEAFDPFARAHGGTAVESCDCHPPHEHPETAVDGSE